MFVVPLIAAEVVAASALAFLASAVTAAYVADWCGFRIVPSLVLLIASAGAVGVVVSLRPRPSSAAPTADSGDGAAKPMTTVVFALVVGVTFGWLLWLARPEFLPTGSGPDLVHHLALVEYIQEHWRLVHDLRLSEYLGEMVDYTPGLHLMIALAAAWLPGDALHLAYPVVAFTVALKAGMVFLIARRLVRADAAPDPFALVAVFAVLVPRVYSIGSFTEQSYLAQVTSELFALAAWWAIVIWDHHPSAALGTRPPAAPMALFGLFSVAGFLVWPVWSGPVLLVLAVVVLAPGDRPLFARVAPAALAAVAVAAVAAMHGARHVGGFRIAGTGGFAIAPSFETVPWPFVTLSAAAVVAATCRRRTRTVPLMLAAIALQAAGLYVAARRSGAAAPYLAIKMFYLAIYPMAIAVAIAAADLWRALASVQPRLHQTRVAWLAALAALVVCAAPVVAAPRPRPVVTEPVLQAAKWAGQHAPRDCIDYLTRDAYTAYWLHLAVFGNPRASGRATDDDTFEPKKALVRWILPGGLPYAVTDDLTALPRDIRDNVDVLARFGDAAVVKRRDANVSPCR